MRGHLLARLSQQCGIIAYFPQIMSSSKSSHSAFKSVDDLVQKPVIGSDGAASWQNFQKEGKHQHRSVAPNIPLKRVDRLAGITSLEDERAKEEEIRKEAGKAGESVGYTVFKRKNEAEEAAARKKRKQIEERIRPDEKKYFIKAETFEGVKFDYVFTTRDRGTGYYWDGTDSLKKLNGTGDFPETPQDEASEGGALEQEKKPKKKKRKKKPAASAPVIVDDPNNPLEQVASAIRRRNEALHVPPRALMGLPAGWEKATDSTGKTYYFCRGTGERQWGVPTVPASVSSAATGTVPSLPPGWSVATDASTGQDYFYHTSGETKWERPTH